MSKARNERSFCRSEKERYCARDESLPAPAEAKRAPSSFLFEMTSEDAGKKGAIHGIPNDGRCESMSCSNHEEKLSFSKIIDSTLYNISASFGVYSQVERYHADRRDNSTSCHIASQSRERTPPSRGLPCTRESVLRDGIHPGDKYLDHTRFCLSALQSRPFFGGVVIGQRYFFVMQPSRHGFRLQGYGLRRATPR